MSDNQTYLEMPDPIYENYINDNPNNIEEGINNGEIMSHQISQTQLPDGYYNNNNLNQNNYEDQPFPMMIDGYSQSYNNYQQSESNINFQINNYQSQFPLPFQNDQFGDHSQYNVQQINNNPFIPYNAISNPFQQSSSNFMDNLQNIQNNDVQHHEDEQPLQFQNQPSNIEAYNQSYTDNNEYQDKQLEKFYKKNEQQTPTMATTRVTFNTSIDKYRALNDGEDDTKNLLRNYGSRLKRDIQEAKTNKNEKNWVYKQLLSYSRKKNILEPNPFIDQFIDKYENIQFSNFLDVRECWKVRIDDPEKELKNAFREICFFFFSKNPLHYIYRESNKVNKKNQRLTHLKYLSVFLKGLIDPSTFQKFKQNSIPQKPKQAQRSSYHTTY